MANKALVKFIKEARKRGFDDYEIREPLLKRGWPLEEIEDAFSSLKPIVKYKNKLNIYLDNDVLRVLERRAKRNLFRLDEQINDILRRSAVKARRTKAEVEKLDDMLVGLFSRRRK